MKKSRTVYILFFLALAGMTTFFCWKYISSEKVSSFSLPLVKITFPDDAKQVERNVWTEDCNVRIYDATGWSVYSSTYAKLEGRGHSTSDKPKKPYNINCVMYIR